MKRGSTNAFAYEVGISAEARRVKTEITRRHEASRDGEKRDIVKAGSRLKRNVVVCWRTVKKHKL